MADIDWSGEPKEVIALDGFGYTHTAITSWEYITLIVPLVSLYEELITKTSYAVVTELVPFDLVTELVTGYAAPGGNPITIPIDFDTPVAEGKDRYLVEIITLGGCPSYQYWG